nr:hypothetical protein GW17_00036843 [Ipomoea batatas]
MRMRSNFDDKAWEDIIGVMDVGVLLHYVRIAALVADGVERFAFSDHIDFVARPIIGQLISSDGNGVGGVRGGVVGAEEKETEQDDSASSNFKVWIILLKCLVAEKGEIPCFFAGVVFAGGLLAGGGGGGGEAEMLLSPSSSKASGPVCTGISSAML